MRTLTLERTSQGLYGTFGELHGLAKVLHSCEPPPSFQARQRYYPHGEPYVSCVPSGKYVLRSHVSHKYGLRWHLLGAGVVLAETDKTADDERFACLCHPANWPSQLEGCISFGLWRGELYRRKTQRFEHGVADSAKALTFFESQLDPESDHRLIVR